MKENKLDKTQENNLRKAYVELISFLNLLDDSYIDKIPEEFMKFINENKDETYEKVVYKNVPLKGQNLMEETLCLIAFINLKYWCNDGKEKEELINVYAKNNKRK